MGYLKIPNLYKDTTLLNFKRVYVCEKVHGTSASLKYKEGQLTFFSGGASHTQFIALFNHEDLLQKLANLGHQEVTIFGEAYGGKVQKMGETYGHLLKFVVFDIQLGESWLPVPAMDHLARTLGLDVVDWVEVDCTIEALNAERDKDSIQAIKNGCGPGKMREGIVIRPLVELTRNNGDRVIAKHKRDDFKETKTPRIVGEVDLKVLSDANAIAQEWVTVMRLLHVVDKLTPNETMITIKDTGKVLNAMVEDIVREGKGEINMTPEADKAIRNATVKMFHGWLKGA